MCAYFTIYTTWDFLYYRLHVTKQYKMYLVLYIVRIFDVCKKNCCSMLVWITVWLFVSIWLVYYGFVCVMKRYAWSGGKRFYNYISISFGVIFVVVCSLSTLLCLIPSTVCLISNWEDSKPRKYNNKMLDAY